MPFRALNYSPTLLLNSALPLQESKSACASGRARPPAFNHVTSFDSSGMENKAWITNERGSRSIAPGKLISLLIVERPVTMLARARARARAMLPRITRTFSLSRCNFVIAQRGSSIRVNKSVDLSAILFHPALLVSRARRIFRNISIHRKFPLAPQLRSARGVWLLLRASNGHTERRIFRYHLPESGIILLDKVRNELCIARTTAGPLNGRVSVSPLQVQILRLFGVLRRPSHRRRHHDWQESAGCGACHQRH